MTKRQYRKLVKKALRKAWPIIMASAKKSFELYVENELKKLDKE